MTGQGLGQMGANQQPQQAPEEFTVDTAARKNADIVNKVRAESGNAAGMQGLGTMQAAQAARGVTQQQQQQQTSELQGLGQVDPMAQSMQIDQAAMAAVQNGQVDPMEVLNDPRVSDQVKASIQGMMV